MGGMVAFELALGFPQLVKSLVIVNSYPEVRVKTWTDRLNVLKRFLTLDLLGMRKTGELLSKVLFIKPEQEELRKLQRALGLTFVFVTHDQEEALSMADRVAVFAEGRIQQVGSAEDIYRRPASRFVADFVGSSNVIPADFAGVGAAGQWASLRPEDITLDPAGREAVVTGRYFHGRVVKLALDVGGQALTALVAPRDDLPDAGQATRIAWDPARVHLMERGS